METNLIGFEWGQRVNKSLRSFFKTSHKQAFRTLVSFQRERVSSELKGRILRSFIIARYSDIEGTRNLKKYRSEIVQFITKF